MAVFLKPESVGFYSIAVSLAETLWMIPGSIATVLFPRVSSIQAEGANYLTPRIVRHTFLVIFVFSISLAIIAKPLIRIFLGAVFLPSVLPFLILLPGIISLGGSKPIATDLAGRGKPQISMYSAIFSLIINVPLNILLIPKWGMSGAAFASSVAYIAATLFVLIAFKKVSNNSYFDVLLIKRKDFLDYKSIISKLLNKQTQEYPGLRK